ncbi:MAG: hypothetical protein KHY47_09185 [Prevotella sp.]|nr:hypothetical protein [Prevotella sp.]
MMVLEKMTGKPLRTSSYQRGLFNTQVKMNIVLNDNMNESSGKAGKGFYPNTELGIDLKLMTKEPGRMAVGEYLDGAITHDGEDHFTFVQNDQEKKLQKVVQRNPHVYPTFNRPQFSERFTFQDFCQGAANELRIISGKSDDR